MSISNPELYRLPQEAQSSTTIGVLYTKILELAKYLDGKLPHPHPFRHHVTQTTTLHCFQMIESKFGCSYKYVKDLSALLNYLEWIRENAVTSHKNPVIVTVIKSKSP